MTVMTTKPIPEWGLLPLLPGGLLLVVLWHSTLCRRTARMSPGELFAGKIVVDGQKVWANPFARNRWLLFTVGLLMLVVRSNTWDALSAGAVYSLSKLLGALAYLAITVAGLVSMGRGTLWPALLIAAQSLFAIMSYGEAEEPTAAVARSILVIETALVLGTALAYAITRKTQEQ